MATNEIQGNVVGIWLNTNFATPDWKEVVCGENLGWSGSRNVSSKPTKCGTIKAVGPASWNLSFSGVANHTPAAGQISINDVIAIFQDEVPVQVKTAHATDETIYYRVGSGHVSAYNENANTEDTLNFDSTIEVSGVLDIDSTP